MDTFNQLRAKARQNRDEAFQRITAEYEATLTRIAELERSLLRIAADKPPNGPACISAVMPTDRAFTVADLVASLEAAYPGQSWRRKIVDNNVGRLRRKGLIRRIHKPHGREPASYVRVGVEVPQEPFDGKTCPEAIAELLAKSGPLLPAEIAVRLLEGKYRTGMKGHAFRSHVGRSLRANRHRFEEVNGRWRNKGKG